MRDLPWALRDVGLPDGLESIYSLRVFLAYLHHFSKAALPDDFEQIESINCQRFGSNRAEIYLEVEGTGTRSSAVPLVGSMLSRY